MSKKSSLKVYGSGGATSHAGAAGYSGYKATEDEWRRPNVAQVYSAEVEEEVKPEGNPLDPYYQNQRDLLEKQKTDDLAALDRNRVQQRQEAAINNELLMKYLPQLNKANGLAGLGVSETANIDALSRYQTNLGKIEATHQQGVSDIERAYRSDLAKIDAAERGEIKEEEQRRYDEAAKKYDEAALYLQQGVITDKESLTNYLKSMGYKEGTRDYDMLSAYASPFIDEETKGENVSPDGTPLPESAPGRIDGEKVKISYPSQNGERGGNLTLYLGGETVDENVIKEAEKKNNGDVWLSGKTMYIKQNGDVYELVDENGGRMSENYGEAYAYFAENKTPDSDFFEKTPETDVKLRSIKDGVVSYTDSTGEEKRAAAVPLSRLYWTPDLKKYKYNENVIFESDGGYYIWQDKNLYWLRDIRQQ